MAHLGDWTKLAEIDPEFNEINKASPPQPKLADFGSPVRIRQLSAALMENNKPHADLSGVSKSTVSIPVRDGSKIHALLYHPITPPAGGSPLNVWYHGGGWCMGDPEDDEWLCADWVRRTGGVAVSVAYRRAPEAPFPGPVQDSWDALRWIAAHNKHLNADPSLGFVLGGASAGGNIATVLSHLARDEGLSPPLTGLVLQVPFLLARQAAPEKYKPLLRSMEQNANAPMCQVGNLDYMIDVYNPDLASPLFSPILWPSGHANMPPTYFQVAGLDPMRDDALLYEKILREEYGVKTKVDVYVGCPHGFWSALPHLEASRRLVNDLGTGWSWLLDMVKVTPTASKKEVQSYSKVLREENNRARSSL